MNNYPPGFTPREEKILVELKCPQCGWEWEELMMSELGGVWFADEDNGGICPECGCEGEIVSSYGVDDREWRSISRENWGPEDRD